MKEDTFGYLTKKLNVSKSTVSKALRHCSGVDSDTRQRILEEARKVNCLPKDVCSVYCILPDVPQYFWKELRQGLIAGENQDIAPTKYNIYTKSSDESAVLEYLREAKQMRAQVLIIAAYITLEIHRQLEEMVSDCMIILLSEHDELKNSFYVGADSYGDGYTMGKRYLTEYAERTLLCLTVRDNINAQNRSAGFLDAVKEKKPCLLDNIIRIEIENELFRDPKKFSSRLASLLSGCVDNDSSYCIYSPIGMAQLPIAVKKAGLTGRAVCMCHDCSADSPNGIDIRCNQDVFTQGYTAARAAVTFITSGQYPPEKNIYIPSKIQK